MSQLPRASQAAAMRCSTSARMTLPSGLFGLQRKTTEPDGALSIAWIKAASTAGVNEKSSASDR